MNMKRNRWQLRHCLRTLHSGRFRDFGYGFWAQLSPLSHWIAYATTLAFGSISAQRQQGASAAPCVEGAQLEIGGIARLRVTSAPHVGSSGKVASEQRGSLLKRVQRKLRFKPTSSVYSRVKIEPVEEELKPERLPFHQQHGVQTAAAHVAGEDGEQSETLQLTVTRLAAATSDADSLTLPA